LAAGTVARSGPFENRALEPERDELLVRRTACRLGTDEPEPVPGGKALQQELRALDPGQRSQVLAASSSRSKATRWSFLPATGSPRSVARHTAAKSWTDPAVASAERDELGIEDGAARRVG
jgi:hypothetical protein